MAALSFDDLVPQQGSATTGGLSFDDLIPAKQAGIAQTIADQANQGLSFGTGDEIGAGLAAGGKYAGDRFIRGLDNISQSLGTGQVVAPNKVTGVNESLSDDYNNYLARNRDNLHNEMEQRPVLSIGSNLAGAIAPIVLSGGTAGAEGVSNWLRNGNLLTRVAKGATLGAASGGLYGLGTGEGGADQRLQSGEQGAVTGGITGGAIPVAGATLSGVGNLATNTGRRIGAIFGNDGAQSTIANQILAKRLTAEGFSPDEIAKAVSEGQTSGLAPTLGEATGSSGVLQTEKTIMRGTGAGANQLRDALSTRNTDTIPTALQTFASQLNDQGGNVGAAYKAASAEAGGASGFDTINNIATSIDKRLGELGSVNNVESKSLNQAGEIVSNAAKRGNTFDALLDAKKQLDNLYLEGADTATQKNASRYVSQFSGQINDALKQMAPEAYPQALTAAKTGMAANDITDALDNTNEGSLATLYNKVWAKPDLRNDFLRKLPDDATRAQATNLFENLGKIKGGFGGSDTAFNLPANQLLSREAGLGFNPELANPFESAPTILNKIGSFAQPGVYNQIAKQSLNTDTAPLLKAMQSRIGSGNSVTPLLSASGGEESNQILPSPSRIPPAAIAIGGAAAMAPNNSQANQISPQSSLQPQNDLFSRVINQESRGNQNAISSKGAIGVAQIMPATAKEAAQAAGLPYDPIKLRTDANYNAALGKAYLGKMQSKYGGNNALALMAYNWGTGNVDMWLKGGARVDRIPAETKNYLTKILG